MQRRWPPPVLRLSGATLASMVCDILDGWRAFPYGLSGQDGATGSGMCTF